MKADKAADHAPWSAWIAQRGALLPVLVVSATCGWAQANGVTVSPVVIEMDSPRRAVAVTITNDNDVAIRLQSAGLVWLQQGGRDRYEPTDDVMVVPAIVEVPAHSSQLFRVALRKPSTSPVERSYRVLLEDISDVPPASDKSGTAGAAITLRFNHNLALMVAPAAKPIQAIRWTPCSLATSGTAAAPPATPAADQTCVRVLNAGNRRMKVKTLTISGDGWQQTLGIKDGINLLAGADREWTLPVKAGQVNTVRSLQVETFTGQVLQGEADAL